MAKKLFSLYIKQVQNRTDPPSSRIQEIVLTILHVQRPVDDESGIGNGGGPVVADGERCGELRS